jgi:putative ABC transport system substrate-binding protein
MTRREFIALLGGAAFAYALPAGAQEFGRTYRLAFLVPVARSSPGVVAFLEELRLNGFLEGQNLHVLPEGFEAQGQEISDLASSLVSARPDIILPGGDLAVRAVQRASQTLPILAMSEDLVTSGFAASIGRPGGNTTGINLLSPELDGKRLAMLLEALPGVQRPAVLADANITPAHHLEALQKIGGSDTPVTILNVFGAEQIEKSISGARAAGIEAINVLSSPMLYLNRKTIYDVVTELRLPTIYQWPEMTSEGGFMAYGPRFTQLFRQRAKMAIKILRGAKPADIPIEQPTNIELAINLKTAKALGLTIPPTLLARADEVIE